MTENIAGFRNNADMYARIERAEARFVFTFGFGFISLMFLGFLSGFFLGRKILQWDLVSSVIMSIVIGVPTIMVEMMLMMFRIHKFD